MAGLCTCRATQVGVQLLFYGHTISFQNLHLDNQEYYGVFLRTILPITPVFPNPHNQDLGFKCILKTRIQAYHSNLNNLNFMHFSDPLHRDRTVYISPLHHGIFEIILSGSNRVTFSSNQPISLLRQLQFFLHRIELPTQDKFLSIHQVHFQVFLFN